MTVQIDHRPHYVLVDPEACVAEVLVWQDGRYEKRFDIEEGAVDFELGPCRIEMDVARLWDR